MCLFVVSLGGIYVYGIYACVYVVTHVRTRINVGTLVLVKGTGA